MTIAERIKGWRKHAGLKPTELAEACRVSDVSVYCWELGRTLPTHENIAKIASACGVPLSKFWGRLPREKRKAS